MPRGRAKPPLVLTEEERETLERWARRPTTAQALALRARIVLRCALGQQNQDVAREIGVTRLTVGRWRQRFVTKRLDGRSEEHTSELQSLAYLVCRLLLEKKKKQ